MKRAYYMGNCINNTGCFVNALMDIAIDITYRTLVKHVGESQLRTAFPDYDWHKPGLHLSEDFAVSFYRSRWKGDNVYIVKHSGIEHFWRMK